MAELPEIDKISRQMDQVLSGKKIMNIKIDQPKSVNLSEGEFYSRSVGAAIKKVLNRGKWIVIRLSNEENILLSLGLGADVLYFSTLDDLPGQYHIRILMEDGSGFTVHYWWFGWFYLLSDAGLCKQPRIKEIAPSPFQKEFTYEYFRNLFWGKKVRVKTVLLDQSKVSGIGNMYIQDILFLSGLHPDQNTSAMKEEDFKILYQNITRQLEKSREKGGCAFELDFFGNKGGFGLDDFLIGYKEGESCPHCGTVIQKIRLGGTASYFCPICQKKK